MKTALTPNNTLPVFYFFDFLTRVTDTLSPIQLTAVDLIGYHICLYQKESGCRFLIPLEQLMYVNQTTAQWMTNYIPPCPNTPFAVQIAQNGLVYDEEEK